MNADDDPEQWVRQYGDALFSYALVRVNDHSTAEDLVQETFLAAVKNRAAFDGRASRLTWLVGILKRKIVDHYRRSGTAKGGKHRSLDDLPEDGQNFFNHRGGFKRTLGKWPADPAETMQNEEFWSVFHQCRRALPTNLRVAFNLREIDQFDTASVCTELGISRSNLAVRIYRARLLLRECLERKWFRDQP
jgi:RNA polymerase sigma-70 factor (ECF subfamily)